MQPNYTTDTIESGTERIAAMTEMLSLIENPRYTFIGGKIFSGYDYRLSFACPSVIGKRKEYVEVLAEKLKSTTDGFEPMYTRLEYGMDLILKCRINSYITFNERTVNKKYKVTHWD